MNRLNDLFVNNHHIGFSVPLLIGLWIRYLATAINIVGQVPSLVYILILGGFYLVIVALLIFSTTDLQQVKVDRASIVFLILGAFFFPRFEQPIVLAIISWGLFVYLLVFARKNWNSLKKADFRWVLISVLLGLCLSSFYGLILKQGVIQLPEKGAVSFILIMLTTHLTTSALPEEYLFRGFLWSFLERKGANNYTVLFVQAGLFWLAHINRVEDFIFFGFMYRLLG